MIRLTSMAISNFKGFYNRQTIDFAIPNGTPGSGLTTIVGPNNSGKTTIIDAFRSFYHGNPPQFDREVRHTDKDVVLELFNSNGEHKVVHTMGSAVGKRVNENVFPILQHIFLISSRRYFADYFHPSEVPHDQHRSTILRLNKTDIDSDFGRVLIGIQNDPIKKEKLDSILKRIIRHFSSWNIELSRGQNYIRYQTGTKDEHSSEFFGDGIISLFKIATALLQGDGEILIIDEPELSLHPQAQKELAKILSEFSSEKQIIVTTHSPQFIRWEDIANGSQIVRLNKIADQECTIHILQNDVKDKLLPQVEDWRKPQLLDTVAKEIFFAENVVFVEGLEDMSLINMFIKRKQINLNFEIFGYGSGGASNIIHLLIMANQLGVKAGALFDGKETALIAQAKQLSDSILIQNISTDDIRDKQEKGIIGLFTEGGTLKPEHEPELESLLNEFTKYFA